MDTITKINLLTMGKSSEIFFKDNHLDAYDIEKIKSTLLSEAKSGNLSSGEVEFRLDKLVKRACYSNNYIPLDELEVDYSDKQKKLAYELNSSQEVTCIDCKRRILSNFKYCPRCGKKIENNSLILACDYNIDFEKGYVTIDELAHMKFLTSDEYELFNAGCVNFEDVGIEVTRNNCPFEVQHVILYNNQLARNDIDYRIQLYEDNLNYHKHNLEDATLFDFKKSDYNQTKYFKPDCEDKENDLVNGEDIIFEEDNKSTDTPYHKTKDELRDNNPVNALNDEIEDIPYENKKKIPDYDKVVKTDTAENDKRQPSKKIGSEDNTTSFNKSKEDNEENSNNLKINSDSKNSTDDNGKTKKMDMNLQTSDKENQPKDKSNSLEELKKAFNMTKKQVNTNLVYASILYLKDTIKHPTNPKLANNTLYWLDISSNDNIHEYLSNHNYIMQAKEMDLIKSNLLKLKVKDLKLILSSRDLPATGKKDDLINRICTNLSVDELNEYHKGRAYIITDKAKRLIDNNPQVDAYIKYYKKLNLEEYEKYYQKNKQNHSLDEIIISYPDYIRNIYIDSMLWYKFKLSYESEIELYKDKKDYDNSLKAFMYAFVCYLNPWSDNLLVTYMTYPITSTTANLLCMLVEKSKLDFDSLYEKFLDVCNDIKLPGIFIAYDDMFEYFIRTFNNEDLDELNLEISNRFDNQNLNQYDYRFKNKIEQEEKYKQLKKYYH